EAERIDVEVDGVLQLVDRQPVSIDRVPQPNKREIGQEPALPDFLYAVLLQGFPFQQAKTFTAERIPAGQDVLVEFLLRKRGIGQPLVADEADQQPDREGAAAEAECVDLVVRTPVIARQERVEVAYVAGETDAEGTAEQRQWAKRGRANAIV